MEFKTLEALILALLFGVPGVVFLLSYSRIPHAAAGIADIRQQLPVELVAFYVTASGIIHCLLLPIFLLVLNFLAWRLADPYLLSRIIGPLLNVTVVDIQYLTWSVLAIVLYFVSSLVVAYALGKWWGTGTPRQSPHGCKNC